MVPRAHPSHHPERHRDRFSHFRMGPKCYAVYNVLPIGRKRPKLLLSPWDFVTLSYPAGGEPNHSHRQHAKNGKNRACGSGDMLADRQTHRHTHKNLLITILRRRSCGRSNKYKNSAGDEIANVNFFTTISHMYFNVSKKRTYFV